MPFRRTLAALVALCAAACSNDPATLRVPVDLVTNPSSITMAQGQQTTVGATVSGISNPVRLEWRSLAPGVASVEPATGSGATVLGIAPGATRIVVSLGGRPDVEDTVAVTVTSPPCLLRSVTLSPNQATIAVGDTVRIRASVPQCNGQPADTSAVWTSLQPAVANVDSFGLVTGLAPGVATVRVASRAAPNIVSTSTITVR